MEYLFFPSGETEGSLWSYDNPDPETNIQVEGEDQQVDPSSKIGVVGEEKKEEETKTYEDFCNYQKLQLQYKRTKHFIIMESYQVSTPGTSAGTQEVQNSDIKFDFQHTGIWLRNISDFQRSQKREQNIHIFLIYSKF